MELKQLRKRLLAAARRANSSFDDEEVDYALQNMLRDMELTDHHSREDTTALACTANDPAFSLTTLNATWADYFRPEKVIRCEIAYNDTGAWSDASVSYLKGISLVSYENQFFVAQADHTSDSASFPGADSSQWSVTESKRGPRINLIDYDTMGRLLVDGFGVSISAGFVTPDNDPATSPDRPVSLAFHTQDQAYLYPVPDVAYLITFTIESEVAMWDAGTEANVEIDVPEKVLLPALTTGGVYYLDSDRADSQQLKRNFEAQIEKIKGALFVNRGVGYKDESAYADGNDPSLHGRYGTGYRWRR